MDQPRAKDDMKTERWKTIPGWETYQISNIGRVKSIDRVMRHVRSGKLIVCRKVGKILSVNIRKKGYPRVGLTVNRVVYPMDVHRLLALAFIPNPKNKPEVNHKNGIKTDFSIENLEWVTSKENRKHASDNRLIKSKLSAEDVFTIRFLKNDMKTSELAAFFNVSVSTIYVTKTNRIWV